MRGQVYRRVLALRTPQSQAASLIVVRRRNTVWVTFQGALKTTVVMDDQDAGQLIEAVCCACGSTR